VKLFRTRRKPDNGEEEKELVLDTDAEERGPAEETAEAGAPATDGAPEVADLAAEAGATPTPGDPLAEMRAEAAAETAAGEKPPEGTAESPAPDDPMDSGLLELFREAKNEVQETTLASELPDIPIQDLLGDLVNIRQELRTTAVIRPEPDPGQTHHRGSQRGQGGK
jgi:hypothetical protein